VMESRRVRSHCKAASALRAGSTIHQLNGWPQLC